MMYNTKSTPQGVLLRMHLPWSSTARASVRPGNVLLSQDPAVQVPSALEVLTVVFGVGTRNRSSMNINVMVQSDAPLIAFHTLKFEVSVSSPVLSAFRSFSWANNGRFERNW